MSITRGYKVLKCVLWFTCTFKKKLYPFVDNLIKKRRKRRYFN